MNVNYLGNTADFADRLSTILKGSRVSSDAIDPMAAKSGTDGVELSRMTAQGTDAVANHFGITDAMATRLVHWLSDEPARLRQIIDDATVRSEIRTILEGGADAFRRRAEKYGGLDDA